MLIVGDEVHPAREPSSMLLVASVQRSPTIRIKSVATAAVRSPAAGLAWLSPSRILVAAGTCLTVMKLNESVLRARSQLPPFHLDDIRDIQAPRPRPLSVLQPPRACAALPRKRRARARPGPRAALTPPAAAWSESARPVSTLDPRPG